MNNPLPITNLSRRNQPYHKNSAMEAMIEQLPYPAMIVNVQKETVSLANTKTASLTGFTRQEIHARNLSDLLPMLERRFLQKTSEDAPVITFLTRRQGPVLEVKIEVTAFLDDKGGWVLLSLQPVSELLRCEAEQRRQDQMLNAFNLLTRSFQGSTLEETLEGVLKAGSILTGANLVVIYKADMDDFTLQRSAAYGPFELLPDQILPNDLVTLQTPFLWNNKKRALGNLHRAARSSNLAFLGSAPLGQPNALVGLVVIAGEQDLPGDECIAILQILASAVTSVLQNFSQLDAVQQSLAAMERDVRFGNAIKEAVVDGVVVVAPDQTVVELNPSAEAIFGYASREVRGYPYQNILVGTGNLIPAVISHQPEVVIHNMGNLLLYRRDGQPFLANVRTLHLGSEERLDYILVLIQDLSQEEQYRVRNQQLEQRALIGEVSAIFAHEVRNPINNMSTGIQLMALTLPPDDPHQETVARLQQDCNRLEALMKSTLAFVKPMKYHLEPVDLKDSLNRLLERWRPHMARRNIQYALQVDPSTPPVEGDVRALEQVWTNLIDNAVQAMTPTGGNLFIKIRPMLSSDSLPMVEVNITDNGPGIPKDLLGRIFEPFYTTNRNGTGLGLSITRHIISTHRGTIRVDSIPGATTFRIHLPVADPKKNYEVEENNS
jgi:two-component system, NtrC family, sensor histidine kinase AtoS